MMSSSGPSFFFASAATDADADALGGAAVDTTDADDADAEGAGGTLGEGVGLQATSTRRRDARRNMATMLRLDANPALAFFCA